jgi:hypothetical protein
MRKTSHRDFLSHRVPAKVRDEPLKHHLEGDAVHWVKRPLASHFVSGLFSNMGSGSRLCGECTFNTILRPSPVGGHGNQRDFHFAADQQAFTAIRVLAMELTANSRLIPDWREVEIRHNTTKMAILLSILSHRSSN